MKEEINEVIKKYTTLGEEVFFMDVAEIDNTVSFLKDNNITDLKKIKKLKNLSAKNKDVIERIIEEFRVLKDDIANILYSQNENVKEMYDNVVYDLEDIITNEDIKKLQEIKETDK